MAELENLSIAISAQTSDVTTGLSRVRENLSDVSRELFETRGAASVAGEGFDETRDDALGLAGAMQLLQGRSDEAGDELLGAGAKAGTTTAGFSALTASTEGLSFSMGTLSSTITLTLIPALAALSTTLIPLVGTLGAAAAGAGALAGAFGLVIGSGALAYGEQLNEQYQERVLNLENQIDQLERIEDVRGELTRQQRRELKRLKEEKKRLDDSEGALSAVQVRLGEVAREIGSVVALWGTGFAPLIRDALDYLPTLTRDVLDAVGGMGRFGDALRGFGQAAADIIPQMAGALARLAEESLPILIDGMEWLSQNGESAFNRLLDTARELGPSLIDLGLAFVDNLPALNQFGITLSQTIIPAFVDIINIAGRVASFFNNLEGRVSNLAFGAVALATPLGIIAALLSGPVALAIGGIIGLLAGLKIAWEDNILNIRGFVNAAGGRLQTILGDRLPAIMENLRGILNNLRVAWGLVGDELIIVGKAILDGLLGVFTTLIDASLTATQIITAVLNGDFREAIDAFGGFWMRTFGGILNWTRQWGNQLVSAILEIVATAIEGAGTNLSNFLNDIPGVDINGNLGASTIASNLRESAQQVRERGAVSRIQTPEGELRLTGELRMNDNDELVATIDERAQMNIAQRETQNERYTDRFATGSGR